MKENKKYFLARYDSKTDQCLGVYENLEEAIKKFMAIQRIIKNIELAKIQLLHHIVKQ